jgi:hypothetical protein
MANSIETSFEAVISKLDDNTQSILKSIFFDNKEDALKLARRAVSVNKKIGSINKLDTIKITNN